jgi:monoamine oxidase
VPLPKRAITRRRFAKVAASCGSLAAFHDLLIASGTIANAGMWSGPPKLPHGRGRRALILGAGIGGLVAAYELQQAGYRCEVLEAQHWAGGRVLTARNGTRIWEESEYHGRTEQLCSFDRDLFAEMGASRIPYHHRRVLHYCQRLGVPLEVFIMSTSANRFRCPFFEDAIPRRQIEYDVRGYLAALLAEAIDKGCFKWQLSESQTNSLEQLLVSFGQCDIDNNTYSGSGRVGCDVAATITDPCTPHEPLELERLLASEFWNHRFYWPDEFSWQPTMLQPKDGMGLIIQRFCSQLNCVRLGAEVKKIEISERGVEIAYRDTRTGRLSQTAADFCVSNIPLPVLATISANFADDFRNAISVGHFEPAGRIGWQANQRFWESDRYQIFGGISYTDHDIGQIWYPSSGFFSDKGTLVGAYLFGLEAENFGRMLPSDRLRFARSGAQTLHEEFADNTIVPQSKGLSIAWQNVPFQRGAWVSWPNTAEGRSAYSRLLAPYRSFYIVGDQVSQLPGWQEGALMSAQHVVEQIGGVRSKAIPSIQSTPDTRRLVQGGP